MEYFATRRSGDVVNLLVDGDTAEALKTESKHFSHKLAISMASSREALWYAIVSQDLGCSHMIIGPSRFMHPPTTVFCWLQS